MRKTSLVVGGLLWSSCADVAPSASEHDEGRAIEAPFVFEPAFDRLILHDAVIDGRAVGDLALEGAAIAAVSGVIEGAHAQEQDGALVLAAERAGLGTLGFVDADLVELELRGVEAAWLDDGAPWVVRTPMTIDAVGFSWDDPGSRLVRSDDEATTATTRAGSSAARGHTVALRRRELAHALASDDPQGPAALLDQLDAELPPSAVVMGEPCIATEVCDAGLFCTQDPMAFPDGQPRCLAMCVPAAPSMPLTCADDDACCDPNAVCSDEGVCVAPDTGGSGSGGGGGCSNDDGPCDDRDGDGVDNGVDQNPDQSCSADADADGCKDSCDGNDMGSNFCSAGAGLPRPNALSLAFVVLVMIRGRRRR